MMKKKDLLKITVCCATAFVFGAASITSANAQIGERLDIQSVAQSQGSSSGQRQARKSVSRVKTFAPQIITRTVTQKVKTTDLIVTTRPGATVRLEPLNPRVRAIPPKTADEQGFVVFEDLKTNKFKITASLGGFETVEQDELEVPPQEIGTIALELERVNSTLTIDTNIREGEVRYARAEFKGKTPDGKIQTVETEGYCIEPIRNGKAVIKELEKGYYNIDIRPGFSDIAYEPVITAVNVSDEDQSYKVNLESKISTAEFSPSTAQDWILPAGWRFDRGLKNEGAAGIALPSSAAYQNYTNFELKSNVRLLNGSSVGFVLRADKDAKNYYLVEISGANAADRNTVKGYIVKNGKREQVFSLPIPRASLVEPQKEFRVIIQGLNVQDAQKPNLLKLSIEDTATAEVFELGNIEDRDKNFRKGAIGVAAPVAASSFEVSYFLVCAGKCP
jgi:hypothetical protein